MHASWLRAQASISQQIACQATHSPFQSQCLDGQVHAVDDDTGETSSCAGCLGCARTGAQQPLRAAQPLMQALRDGHRRPRQALRRR